MRKLVMALYVLCASGPSSAELITYLDAKGLPMAFSSRVGNQIVIMDKFARPNAFVPLLDIGSQPTTRNTPSGIEPLILPKAVLTNDKPLPYLSPLPTISNGLLD
jgi:hypothetical protein